MEKPLDMRTTQGRQQNENFYHRRWTSNQVRNLPNFWKYGYQCASSSDFQYIAETALFRLGLTWFFWTSICRIRTACAVCREIRQKSNLPIIEVLRNSDFDELMSLNIGADDYISKPYNAQVLLARIQKLLARTYEIQDNVVLTHKGLTLKPAQSRNQLPRTEKISY